MKISANIPKWYHFDSSFNNKKDAEKRVSELRKENKNTGTPINIRLTKRNEKFFSVFTYQSVSKSLRK